MLSDGILSRFDMYAGRIRVLSEGYLLPEVRLTAFASMCLTRHRCPLLPGLREIRIFDIFEHEWTIFLSLCSTKLKIVDLGNENGDSDEGRHVIGTFLHSLGRNGSHGLEKLRYFTLRDNYVDVITKFRMLQDVELSFSGASGQLLVESFSKLSVLDHLSRLCVDWDVDPMHHSFIFPLLPPHSVNFLSLHSIEISVPTHIALLLVQCLRANTLEHIQIDCLSSPLHQTTTSGRVVDECGLVSPGLQEVSLHFYATQPNSQATFGAVLRLTRRFRLRTLKFTCSGLEIDNISIHQACFSRYFSHLEILDLGSDRRVPHNSLTFHVLRLFATHCPLLKDLTLTLTVEDQHLPSLIKETENEHPLSHCLKRLSISFVDRAETTQFVANAESIPIVSQYLDTLFPSLDLIRGYSHYPTFIKAVHRTLKGLQRRSIVDSRRSVGPLVIKI